MPGIYLDSCIVIYLVEGAARLRERIGAGLFSAAEGVAHVVVSDLTRLECRVGPLRIGDGERLASYERFFASRNVTTIPLTTDVVDRATELRARHGLRTPDALHVAAGICAGCDLFLTNDRRLRALGAPGERMAVRTLEDIGISFDDV